jgi:hypothetical protein
VDRRLVRDARLDAAQVLVEETQHFSQQRKLRLLRVAAPREAIGARAVVPGAQQQAVVRTALGQVARDRRVRIRHAVVPARDRIDRHLARRRGEIPVEVAGAGVQVRIVRGRLLAVRELGREIAQAEAVAVLVDRRAQQGAVRILVHGLRTREPRIVEIRVLREGVALVEIERAHQRVVGGGDHRAHQAAPIECAGGLC